jgi:DUF4097 and DUF4098 domain-containing protein YvlB
VRADASLVTASGDVRLQDVGGDVSVNTASGDALIARVGGDFTAKTASGDVRIGQAGRSAEVRTASGDVRIDAIAAGRVDVTSVCGDVAIAVPPGTGVFLDLATISGRVRSDLDPDARGGDDGEASLTVRCNSRRGKRGRHSKRGRRRAGGQHGGRQPIRRRAGWALIAVGLRLAHTAGED